MYADVLVGINFLFNLYLLWLTSLAARYPKTWSRMSLGALLGALFSLTLLLPGRVPGAVNLSFPFFMVFAAFYPFSLFQGLKLVSLFYGVTLLSVGALITLQVILTREPFVPGSGVFILPSPSLFPLLLAFLLAVAVVRMTWVGLNNWRALGAWKGQVTVRRGGKEKNLEALVDTGNTLREPVSGSPVIIVHYLELLSLLEGLSVLPEKSPEEKLACLTRDLSMCVDAGIYVVPYRSLGKEGGYLPGFRPDEVVISVGRDCRLLKRNQVVICLTPQKVSRENPALALVHPELICGGG